MKKSPFATPVERFLVENQHVRRLCIGFWSKRSKCHEKVTVCDTCRALLGPVFMKKSAFATPVECFLVENQHLRRLCIGFWSKRSNFHEKVTVCDACRALLGPGRLAGSILSLLTFEHPVQILQYIYRERDIHLYIYFHTAPRAPRAVREHSFFSHIFSSNVLISCTADSKALDRHRKR